MKFGSVCSGIEAASVAWNPLGWEAAWFSEIEPFPREVLKHHYPNVRNYGDMRDLPAMIWEGEVDAPDILCGGTPCFVGDTLVLTEDGYKPIKSIKVGDKVMTHQGRLRKVLRIGNKESEIGELNAVGHRPILCTENHPFLSIEYKTQSTRRNGKSVRIATHTQPEWVKAKDMAGRQWLAISHYNHTYSRIVPMGYGCSQAQALFFIGMYLGDGYIRRFTGKNKKAVVLCLNDKKLSEFNRMFDNVSATVVKERTAYKVTVYDTDLADFLSKNFGEHSDSKRIPAWVLEHRQRQFLLDGYLLTDGSKIQSGYSITTVSEKLAFGITDLMNTLGYVASTHRVEMPKTCIIEGRVCNQKDQFQIRAYLQQLSRKSRMINGWICRKVQGFKTIGRDIVYNIEVEEDNSYIIEGVVVHNCQAFSVAGLRKSLDDDRGNLSLVFCEIANAIDAARFIYGEEPCIVFWENVPGVLSTKDNAFGCFMGGGWLEATFPLRFPMDGGRVQVMLPAPKGKQRGASLMLNISECPNDAKESSLSQVLERTSIHPKYYLSARACQGILNRAKARGKILPERLRLALEQAVTPTS